MKLKIVAIAASIALMIVTFGAYMVFFSTPQVYASITLQVNPSVTLSLNDRNIVVGAEGLNDDGKVLLSSVNLQGKEVLEALHTIVAKMRETNVLTVEQRILVAVKPLSGNLKNSEINKLAETVENALDASLKQFDSKAKVISTGVTTDLNVVLEELNLKPEVYVPVIVGIGSESATKILNMRNDLSIDPALFSKEFNRISSSFNRMQRAGISVNDALALLRSSIAADPTLRRLRKITEAVIDLHEIGTSQEELKSVFGLFDEQLAAGLSRNLLIKEFSTMVAAKIDMMEIGLTSAQSLSTLRLAMSADPTLEELTTITSAKIDLIEKGLSQTEALVKIQAAIKANPTLNNFDDLLEYPESNDIDSDDSDDDNDSKYESDDSDYKDNIDDKDYTDYPDDRDSKDDTNHRNSKNYDDYRDSKHDSDDDNQSKSDYDDNDSENDSDDDDRSKNDSDNDDRSKNDSDDDRGSRTRSSTRNEKDARDDTLDKDDN